MKLLWGLALVTSALSVVVLIHAWLTVLPELRRAVAPTITVGLAVVTYCIARAVDELKP